jgi:hypothetical protein
MPSLLSDHNGVPRPYWPVHIDRFQGCGRDDVAADPLRPWTEMLKRGIVKLINLPEGLHHPFQQIDNALSIALQRRSAVIFGADKRCAGLSNPAGNSSGVTLAQKVKLWPMPTGQRAQDGSTWVHLSSVLPEALELCAKLLSEIDTVRALGARSATAWLAKIDEQHHWKPILMAVLQTLIRRGYAWGLRYVLAKQVREIHSDKHIAPQRRVPVLALMHGPTGITGAEIAWVRPSTVRPLSDEAISRSSRHSKGLAARKRQRR